MLIDRFLTRRRAARADAARRTDPRPPAPVRRHREPMPRMRWYA